ncbi:hypothetical protein [Kibdelosporangium phytohabitans]|nr:hypothetical protein [Kibdelosporangium phytohabitans]MBE1466591.1 hypothetical protein [Kibdelosporangium phytohabitans]
MDELEQQLRSTLTSMAEEVPPSHGAWNEQQRRLALKSRKHRVRPAVTAIVAAAAAVLIAVPIMVIQQGHAPVDPGALPEVSNAPERTTTGRSTLPDGRWRVSYEPRDGETVVTQPTQITNKVMADRKNLITWAYVIQASNGDRHMCIAQTVEGGVINGPDQLTYGEPDCIPLTPPKAGKFEWGRRQVPDKFLEGNKGIWLYVMSRPAVKMTLRRAENNELIPATTKEFGADVVFFGAFVNSSKPPLAYSLYNDADDIFYNGV